MDKSRPIIVGISGASGVIYGIRFAGRLIEAGYCVDMIVTDNAKTIIKQELDFEFSISSFSLFIQNSLLTDIDKKRINIYDINDISSPPASGAAGYESMVVIPCSMKTLSAIAVGRSSNLLERAADVILKEKKKLIVVPRETPLSSIHLRNMLAINEAGGIVLPAIPAFYFKPEKIDDLVDFIIAKIFSILEIQSHIIKKWGFQ